MEWFYITCGGGLRELENFIEVNTKNEQEIFVFIYIFQFVDRTTKQHAVVKDIRFYQKELLFFWPHSIWPTIERNMIKIAVIPSESNMKYPLKKWESVNL